jgi:heme-degrading monooxygenase HmoA
MPAGTMVVRRPRKVSRREVGMIVRTASAQVASHLIDEIVSRYRETVHPIHQQAEGLRNHHLLVDRDGGRMRLIGFWDSQEALKAATQRLNRLASGSGAGSR